MATLLNNSIGFNGFGPSILAPQMRGRLRRIVLPSERLVARKKLRKICPKVPGVYGWLDENQQLVYVGKSKTLLNRLLSYFAKTPADKKMERIRQHSREIVWEPVSHELLALIREQELIYRWRPEFNSMGQPIRMRPAFVSIAGSPAPNARLAYRLTDNHSKVFGPITGTNRLRQAIVSLNQTFKLRDCADKTKFQFGDQRKLFEDPTAAKCIRHELGTCPAPCAAKCSSAAYAGMVDDAIDFLNGNSQTTLRLIESKMEAAARNAAFESAIIYRDCLENLTWLNRRLTSLRKAEKDLNGVLQLPARRKRTAWVILRGGKICRTFLQPDNPRRAAIAHDEINQIMNTDSVRPNDRLEISLQLIIISWSRKFPAIEQQILDFDSALNICEQFVDKPILVA